MAYGLLLCWEQEWLSECLKLGQMFPITPHGVGFFLFFSSVLQHRRNLHKYAT